MYQYYLLIHWFSTGTFSAVFFLLGFFSTVSRQTHTAVYCHQQNNMKPKINLKGYSHNKQLYNYKINLERIILESEFICYNVSCFQLFHFSITDFFIIFL